ncbi:hypothetical protein JNUCC1_00212 [Lentibacillus sp. JNUCC-1]|uniref:hypothetical protein n=1 Tax=Lentibacillus sp. JNUCC-1 TaxID=2654513 RepID=UPI0012E8DE8F|nr:hypothetical protein [Lentibacillus sp. JNUCC-1]MUV36410.1 hypothetical protein [Lentibacillus sp. JNUCC-1]
MQKHLKHVIIGVAGGVVLALFLQVIHWITGSNAYILLYNVDYIPILKETDNEVLVGILFHFVFCIASVALLYPILNYVSLEDSLWAYVFIYTGGSGLLYSLTGLTERPHNWET